MPEFQFEDKLFDDPAENRVHFHSDERLKQQYLRHKDRIFCETMFTTSGSVEDAIRLLRGPWDWWRHGRATRFQVNPDGSTSQVLAPVWWHITRVGVRIHPRRDLIGTGGVRLAMTVNRNFRGVASLDIYPDPARETVPGGIVIRERYHGVENHVPLIPIEMATRIHLRAEAGALTFPFPGGTGFRGLWQVLEAAPKRRAAAR